jgi:hypothetical protein
MAIHGPANQLAGDCVTVPNRICMPFKEFCIHTLMSSPAVGQPTNPEAGTFGCMANISNAGTQFLPDAKVPNNINIAPIYGITDDPVQLDLFHQSADLAPWRSRKIFGPSDPYGKATSGPALAQGHMVTEVRRRLRGANPNNANYSGRYSFYFTDSSAPLNGEDDWLRYMHPSGLFWTNKNISEPFLAANDYESSGSNPVTTDTYNQYFIPFCSPLNVYSEAGFLQGQYIGYTVIYYFGFSYIRLPFGSNRPEDYYVSPQPTPPIRVTTENQFISLDCHLFMVGAPAYSGSLIKSPKLNSVRYWFYNKPTSTYNICQPYIYSLFGPMTTEWKFDVKFKIYGGGEEIIKFGLSNFRAYVTP